jgi:predicted PurR-regulated permease PerM
MSWLSVLLVIGVLWTAKAVLLPLALGIILAFMLTPLVRFCDRLHLPRFAGVMLTMMLALGLVGGVGYVIWNQFADLSTQITRYTSSMRQKVSDARTANGAALRELARTLDKVTEQLDGNLSELRNAQPVRVIPQRLSPGERLQEMMREIFEPIASAVIVIVLVAFMLGQREDLRNRIIRLMGAGNVTTTTRLMDEAGHRVSQFLVWQTLVNLIFGTAIGAGLYWIGLPYAALWGGLTALLRFVPFVGTLLSSLLPAALAFATFPGWTEMLQTLGLFLVLDLSTAYLVEPLIFGHRTGVSSFALLVSALFWIWIWGPVGLLLATPLTVCFAVLGRHVRSLRFLAVIFADEPALQPHVRYYQRLLARDEDEAHSIVNRMSIESGMVEVMDQVLIPALALAAQHRMENEITDEAATFIQDATAEIVQQFRVSQKSAAPAHSRIIGVATASAMDRLVLEMLQIAMQPQNKSLIALAAGSDVVAEAEATRAELACIVSLSPTRGAEVRGFCRQLRAERPDTQLLVLRPLFSDTGAPRSEERMKEAGATIVVTTIANALRAVDELDCAVDASAALTVRSRHVARNEDATVGQRIGAEAGTLTPAR